VSLVTGRGGQALLFPLRVRRRYRALGSTATHDAPVCWRNSGRAQPLILTRLKANRPCSVYRVVCRLVLLGGDGRVLNALRPREHPRTRLAARLIGIDIQ
jgi:hypothetical protein